jgi:hypothetical protein
VAVVGRLVQKWERDCTTGETVNKTVQNQYRNTEYTKQKTKIQNKNKQQEY